MEFCYNSFFLQILPLKIYTHYTGIYANKQENDLWFKYPDTGIIWLNIATLLEPFGVSNVYVSYQILGVKIIWKI